ncbi:streptamidine-related RiPP repeat protein [Clavibacter sp. MX14-G9D]|nr:streptamidine-related RiPP repeat protein [Clavibacter sp. MX14-G9D]
MIDVSITRIAGDDVLSAPQGPGTNALVHNPFALQH